MTRVRTMLRGADLLHVHGDVLELARVPCPGEYLRMGQELYMVGSVVHTPDADVAAELYLARREPLAELPAQLA